MRPAFFYSVEGQSTRLTALLADPGRRAVHALGAGGRRGAGDRRLHALRHRAGPSSATAASATGSTPTTPDAAWPPPPSARSATRPVTCWASTASRRRPSPTTCRPNGCSPKPGSSGSAPPRGIYTSTASGATTTCSSGSSTTNCLSGERGPGRAAVLIRRRKRPRQVHGPEVSAPDPPPELSRVPRSAQQAPPVQALFGDGGRRVGGRSARPGATPCRVIRLRRASPSSTSAIRAPAASVTEAPAPPPPARRPPPCTGRRTPRPRTGGGTRAASRIVVATPPRVYTAGRCSSAAPAQRRPRARSGAIGALPTSPPRGPRTSPTRRRRAARRGPDKGASADASTAPPEAARARWSGAGHAAPARRPASTPSARRPRHAPAAAGATPDRLRVVAFAARIELEAEELRRIRDNVLGGTAPVHLLRPPALKLPPSPLRTKSPRARPVHRSRAGRRAALLVRRGRLHRTPFLEFLDAWWPELTPRRVLAAMADERRLARWSGAPQPGRGAPSGPFPAAARRGGRGPALRPRRGAAGRAPGARRHPGPAPAQARGRSAGPAHRSGGADAAARGDPVGAGRAAGGGCAPSTRSSSPTGPDLAPAGARPAGHNTPPGRASPGSPPGRPDVGGRRPHRRLLPTAPPLHPDRQRRNAAIADWPRMVFALANPAWSPRRRCAHR
ncbi:hypothetical protein SCALM49S_04649 [Streptomyces californicus]